MILYVFPKLHLRYDTAITPPQQKAECVLITVPGDKYRS